MRGTAMESNPLINNPTTDLAWESDPSTALGSQKVILPHLGIVLIVSMIILLLVIGSIALRDIHLVNFMHFQIDVLADHAAY
jgi:hypothetical protein